jgi:uncharacterized protein (TIGR03437 family)
VVKNFALVHNLQLIRIPEGISLEEAARQYRSHPDVLYVEPNYLVWADVIPNDPSFSQLWALHSSSDRDIDAPEAWDLNTGSNNIVVAVIDTGIDYNHQDLAANMFRNEVDCTPNSVDDDGNGFVDDCFGIDTANNDPDPMDDNNHGTHVAGTIGAVGNNGVGVVGVNWTVRLISCKFLGADGSGTTADAIGCFDYVALMKDRGVNIVATNNSWGGGGFSQALLDAIQAHRQRGILTIAAAGNDSSNNDVSAHYPSNYYAPNVLSVAATTQTDLLSSFSNSGRRTVHLGAPGSAILSTTPGNTYQSFNGTSMATPHVTGVAALLKAQDPGRDWKAIKNLILAGGDNNTDLTNTITQKRINAFGAMTCSNSIVLSRLQPIPNFVNATLGRPVNLAVLHINCAAPNGAVDVTVNPGGVLITLSDDGVGPDQEAGDGIYSGQWTPSVQQPTTLTFPGGDVVSVQVLSSYTLSSTTFNYRNIAGTSLNFTDDSTAQITSPFPIAFGGLNFTNLFVSSNGNINVNSLTPFDNPNLPLPTTLMESLIAPFWDDLYPGTPDQNVFWQVIGAVPNRELVVEWRDLRAFDCLTDATATVRFQVVFFENSSDVLFNYADTIFGGACAFHDGGKSATVGLQVSPSSGLLFSFDNLAVGDSSALLWQLGSPPTPALNTDGTVNGGSFTTGLAAGSIASTFGTNLALATASASAVPLPNTLAGATLRFNGSLNVPQFFASATQINLQIPWELAGQPSASLTDSIGEVTSAGQTVNLVAYGPGLFATNQAGSGQGAILISGSGGLVAAPVGTFPGSRPVNRSEFIEIFCTGLGPVTNQPTSGSAAGSSPLSLTTSVPTVTIGGVPAVVSFSGLAPGFVGLYQVNVQVPAGAPTGGAVPVALTIGGVTANTVTIAVQ